MEYDNGAVDGARITSNRMLHDMEAEYVVKNISKENAQALLNEFPEHYYITDKYYDATKRRLEFIIMLDDVAPIEVSDHYDYMEQNHPECKKRFEQLHDSRTAFDDADNDEYYKNAIDLTQFVDRTLP